MSFWQTPGADIENFLGFGPAQAAAQPQITPIDPRLQALVDQQNQQAQSFQANLPTYEQDQYSLSSSQQKNQAQQQSQNITANANQRGLLYSGINTGAQAQNQGALSTNLAATKGAINQNAQNQSTQLNATAAQGSQGLLNIENQNAQSNYQAQMNIYNQKMQGIGQLGQMAGGLALTAGLLI